MKVDLVQASSDDLEFCFSVTETVMRGYVEATWGSWDHRAEKDKFEAGFTPQWHRLIVVDAERAGIVEVEEHPDHAWLSSLFLLPAFQGRGIGAFVLSQVITASARRPVRLRALAVNLRAQRFYERHGFVATSRTPERVYMERPTDLTDVRADRVG